MKGMKRIVLSNQCGNTLVDTSKAEDKLKDYIVIVHTSTVIP